MHSFLLIIKSHTLHLMYLIYQDNIQLKNIFRILQGDLESLQRCVAAIFEAPIIHNEVKLVKKLIVSNKHPPPSIYCNQMDGNKYVWPTSPTLCPIFLQLYCDTSALYFLPILSNAILWFLPGLTAVHSFHLSSNVFYYIDLV